MKKHLGMIVGAGLIFFGLNESNAYQKVDNNRLEYIDPFSLPITPYDELNEEQKEYIKLKGEGLIRTPMDAPGAKIANRYILNGDRRDRCGCDLFGNLLGGIFRYRGR